MPLGALPSAQSECEQTQKSASHQFSTAVRSSSIRPSLVVTVHVPSFSCHRSNFAPLDPDLPVLTFALKQDFLSVANHAQITPQ